MYTTYPRVILKKDEADAAPLYTRADYDADVMLGNQPEHLGFAFYQAVMQAVQNTEAPEVPGEYTGRADEVAKIINRYFRDLREPVVSALQKHLVEHDGWVGRWPDPDTGYTPELRSDNSYNYLDWIFHFHFFAKDYKGKQGVVNNKYVRPEELCASRYLAPHIPEYGQYAHKWFDLNENVKKAGLFSKKQAKKALEAFEEANEELKDADAAYKRNYNFLVDEWTKSWLQVCQERGLKVCDPDIKKVKQVRYEEFKEQNKSW